MLKDKDKERAITMLNTARDTLEQEVRVQKRDYQALLVQTSDLQPQDLNLAWRVLVSGLNRFNQSQRLHEGNKRSESESGDPNWESIRPWFLPEKTILDQAFVQACVGDLTSVEDRATLRMGVIGAFLVRYSEGLKHTSTKSAGSSFNPAAPIK